MKTAILLIFGLSLTASAGIQPFSHQQTAQAVRTTQAAIVAQTQPLPRQHQDAGKFIAAFGTTLCHIPHLMGIQSIPLGSITVSPAGCTVVLPTVIFTQTSPGVKSVTLPTIPIK